MATPSTDIVSEAPANGIVDGPLPVVTTTVPVTFVQACTWVAFSVNLIFVTGSDVAAAGAEISARPAITPTAAASVLRTMRWPLPSVRVSRKESASEGPKLEGGSTFHVAGERRTGRSRLSQEALSCWCPTPIGHGPSRTAT